MWLFLFYPSFSSWDCYANKINECILCDSSRVWHIVNIPVMLVFIIIPFGEGGRLIQSSQKKYNTWSVLSAQRAYIRSISLGRERLIKVRIWKINLPVGGEWNSEGNSICKAPMVGGSTTSWELGIGQGEGEQEGGRVWRLKVRLGPGCAGTLSEPQI